MSVAILGEGVSGRAAAHLLQHLGEETIRFFDERRQGDARSLELFLAQVRPRVIYSPGFAFDHPWRQRVRAQGIKEEGELAFSLTHWPGRLWAVTGTNGKSTLTAFLAQALQLHGIEAYASGNIGVPISDLCVRFPQKKHAVAVCEVSSFQAECLTQSCAEHVFWTNLEPDHLQRYICVEAYAQAKLQLVRSATQACVWAPASVYEHPCLTSLRGAPVAPSVQAPSGSLFAQKPYDELYLLAAAAWAHQGFPLKTLERSALAFKPLPHRMQRVCTHGQVEYWNDSKATNAPAALAAVRALEGAPIFWIGGGADKGECFKDFTQILRSKIKQAYLVGETASSLHAQLFPHSRCYPTLEAALQAAHSDAQALQAPCHVLLSPACASFGLFDNYAHRGEAFLNLLKGLGLSF